MFKSGLYRRQWHITCALHVPCMYLCSRVDGEEWSGYSSAGWWYVNDRALLTLHHPRQHNTGHLKHTVIISKLTIPGIITLFKLTIPGIITLFKLTIPGIITLFKLTILGIITLFKLTIPGIITLFTFAPRFYWIGNTMGCSVVPNFRFPSLLFVDLR